MKTCPACQTQYTDDTLRFCLQDGSPLVLLPATMQPTVELSADEIETSARAEIPPPESEVTHWHGKSEVTRAASSETPVSSMGSKTAIAVAVVAISMLLLVAVIGVGAWLYLRKPAENVRNANNANNGINTGRTQIQPTPSPGNGSVVPFLTPTRSPSPKTPDPYVTPVPMPSAPQVDKQQISRNISQQIYDWKSLAEARDLNAYMRKYAGTVDYYRKRGASSDVIRGDKQRAFQMFNSISLTISDLNVSVDDSGETATAVFDKQWVFNGNHLSTGKVQQQMQFRKISGEWLITGERDLKVYYTNR